jgi:tetratricopeptide (TPR) repeat protein
LLVLSCGFTVNRALRSEALAEARAAAARTPLRLADVRLVLRRALDHLDAHPRDGEAARLAALSLSRLDFATRAEPLYSLAEGRGKLSIDDQRVRALALMRARANEEAASVLKQILAERPDDADALERLAAIEYDRNRLQDALGYAERLSLVAGSEVAGHTARGLILHDAQEPEQAASAFETVLKLDPGLRRCSLARTAFYKGLGQALLEAGRPADARRHLERAIAAQSDPALTDLLGTAFHAEGLDHEAERCWREAAAADPALARPWINLGVLKLEAGDPAEAVRLLERAGSLDASALEPAYYLSLALPQVGRKDEAEDYRLRADRIRRRFEAEQRANTSLPSTPP